MLIYGRHFTMSYLFQFHLALWIRKCRKEGKNTKTWIFQEWKELFRWNKKHFPEFLKSLLLVKNKKIVEASFKFCSIICFGLTCIWLSLKLWMRIGGTGDRKWGMPREIPQGMTIRWMFTCFKEGIGERLREYLGDSLFSLII